jgi:putative transposase
VAVSMDGKGRCLDNVFVERLWRSVKQEDVYLRLVICTYGADRRSGPCLSFG